nr:hypothetical protein [uncultured Glaciecola sp.]
MKTLTKVILISMIFALPAYAQDKDKHEHTDDAEHESMDGMTNHQEMMPMHQHMLEMQDLMKKIKQEKDPKERQELMQKHMASMQTGMHMMKGNMGNHMSNKNGMKEMGKKSMNMDKCMHKMEDRVDMMEMMLEQMMEHDNMKMYKNK